MSNDIWRFKSDHHFLIEKLCVWHIRGQVISETRICNKHFMNEISNRLMNETNKQIKQFKMNRESTNEQTKLKWEWNKIRVARMIVTQASKTKNVYTHWIVIPHVKYLLRISKNCLYPAQTCTHEYIYTLLKSCGMDDWFQRNSIVDHSYFGSRHTMKN